MRTDIFEGSTVFQANPISSDYAEHLQFMLAETCPDSPTALIFPTWTESLADMHKEAVKRYPKLAGAPILSCATSTWFWKPAKTITPGDFKVVGLTIAGSADILYFSVASDSEALTYIFDVQVAQTAKALRRWAKLGFIPTIFRHNGLSGFVRMPFDGQLLKFIDEAIKPSVVDAKQRIQLALEAFRQPEIQAKFCPGTKVAVVRTLDEMYEALTSEEESQLRTEPIKAH